MTKSKISLIISLLVLASGMLFSAATGSPGTPGLTHDNWDNDGNYTITMSMWWGNNGTSYKLYENDTLIHTETLSDNTPNQQSISVFITGKSGGAYIYTCDLINAFGTTTGAAITVNVAGGGSNPTPTATPVVTATPTPIVTVAPTASPTTTPVITGTPTPTATAVVTATPTAGQDCEPEWNSTDVYNTNDTVRWNCIIWQAKWYTVGEEPGTTGQWGVWNSLGADPCCGGNQTPTPTATPIVTPVVTATPTATAPSMAQTIKVAVFNFDPIIEHRQSQKLHVLANWNDPAVLSNTYVNDLLEVSDNRVEFKVVEWNEVDEFPLYTDGFRYDDTYIDLLDEAKAAQGDWWNYPGWHGNEKFDYDYYLTKFNLPQRVESGEIDEVWFFGGAMWGMNESIMIGRTAFWCNGSPIIRNDCDNFIIMGFNYERGVGEMLEDITHRTESIMTRVYGRWATKPGAVIPMNFADLNAWEKFSLYDKIVGSFSGGVAGCGNVHYAPNSIEDYDWKNATFVLSTCNDWKNNYPNLTGVGEMVNTTTWGNGDIRAHHKWWLDCLPNAAGTGSDGMLQNWWYYITLNYDETTINAADLIPTAIIYDNTNLQVGKAILFDTGIENAGPVDTENFNIKWFVNDSQEGYGQHTAVPANTIILDGNSQFYWTPQASGTYEIRFLVDADNSVAELNETNNELSVTVVIN